MLKNQSHSNLPDQSAVAFQLALHLHERHLRAMRAVSTSEAYQVMADRFGLTSEELNRNYASGRNQWVAIVGFAKDSLRRNGVIKPTERDQWVITELGIRRMEQLRGAANAAAY